MAVEMVAGIGGELIPREVKDVKKYSKLKLISTLMEYGLWSQVKEWMVTNDVYDLFVAAQFISSEHTLFYTMKSKLQSDIGISDDVMDKILSLSEDSEI